MGKFYYSKNKVLLSKKRALLREKRITQGLQNLANTVAGLGGRYWTKERILADALKYKTRNEWAKASGGAFIAAKKLGIYEETVPDKNELKDFITNKLGKPNKNTWSNVSMV